MGLVLGLVGVFGVHGLDLEQGEEAFLVLGRTDLAGDQVAGLEVEAADLRRGDVNVLRAGQVIEAAGAEEAEAFGEHFQDAFGEQHAGALGVLLEDLENHLVLAHRAEILDAHFLGHVVEVGHGHGLELGDVHGGCGGVAAGRAAGGSSSAALDSTGGVGGSSFIAFGGAGRARFCFGAGRAGRSSGRLVGLAVLRRGLAFLAATFLVAALGIVETELSRLASVWALRHFSFLAGLGMIKIRMLDSRLRLDSPTAGTGINPNIT